MPYIKQAEREAINAPLEELIGTLLDSYEEGTEDGALNYVVSRIVSEVLNPEMLPWRYADIARAVAVFECAKLEFYDRIARPKEDLAIQQNGDIPAYGA